MSKETSKEHESTNVEKLRVEVIVGRVDDPMVHLVTTIGDIKQAFDFLAEVQSWGTRPLMTHAPYMPMMAMPREEDSPEVRRIKSNYSQLRDMERASFDAKIRELNIKQDEEIFKAEKRKMRGDGPASSL